MSHIFRIGDRVRIVGGHGVDGRRAIGKEGVINELSHRLTNSILTGYGVTISGFLPLQPGCDDTDWCFVHEHLEPIQRSDDKSQSSSDEMPADTLQVVSELLSKIARVGEFA